MSSFLKRYFSCGRSKPDMIVNPITEIPVKTVIQWKETIPFIPPITGGQVIKVYDGDTITIASKLPYVNSPMYRFAVRLNGIDAAEIKGKSFAEKEIAIQSRDALSAKIMGQYVDLQNVNTEKYGRVLADVYLGDIHINQWLLDNKYAIRYDGGTKYRPAEWEDVYKMPI